MLNRVNKLNGIYDGKQTYPTIFAQPMGNRFVVNITSDFDSSDTYDEIVALLSTATDADEIVWNISSYGERNKDIDATITELNSVNDGLHQTIKDFTKRSSNSSSGSVRNTSDTESLQLAGELLGECIGRKQYYAEEASKLSNSVITLQEWGDAVIKQNEGEKDE